MYKLMKSIVAMAIIAAFAAFLLLTNPGRTAAQGPPGGAPVVVQNTPLPTAVTNWPNGNGVPLEKWGIVNMAHGVAAATKTFPFSLTEIGINERLIIEYVSAACSGPSGASYVPEAFYLRIVNTGTGVTNVPQHTTLSPLSGPAGYTAVGQQLRHYVETGQAFNIQVTRSDDTGAMGCDVSFSGRKVTLP